MVRKITLLDLGSFGMGEVLGSKWIHNGRRKACYPGIFQFALTVFYELRLSGEKPCEPAESPAVFFWRRVITFNRNHNPFYLFMHLACPLLLYQLSPRPWPWLEPDKCPYHLREMLHSHLPPALDASLSCDPRQSFWIPTLLTFWAGKFFPARDCPVHYRMYHSISGLCH